MRPLHWRCARRWFAALLALFAFVACPVAQAHLLNMTKIVVGIDVSGQVTVDMQVDLNRAVGGSLEYYQLSRSKDPATDSRVTELMKRLVAAVDLRVDAANLPLQLRSMEFPQLPKETFLDPLSWPMTHVVLVGTSAVSLEQSRSMQGMLLPTFPFEEPISLTFSMDAGQRTMTRWLVAGQASPSFPFEAGAESSEAEPMSVTRYVVFGFTHILPKGLDHVLFVLGLFLGARSFRSLLILVTSFTLAHSITLALASVGAVRLPTNIVEALVAASIVWVGVENFLIARSEGVSRSERWRPLIVFGFGLLHGLGFASALSELRLPPENFLLALLSFNIGIELGQLTVIAIAAIATIGFRSKPWYRDRVTLPASMVIALLAAIWTVQRAMT